MLFFLADLREHLLLSDQRTMDMKAQDRSKNQFQSFAKTIRFLCTHRHETETNRTFLRKMIMKWTGPLTGVTSAVIRTSKSIQNPVEVQHRARQLRERKSTNCFFSVAKAAAV